MTHGRAEVLLAFLRRNFPTPSGAEITLDTPLLTQQILDSMGVVLFATFIEEQFRVPFDGGELRKGRLESARAVAALIERLA